jgi:hypothetical protein
MDKVPYLGNNQNKSNVNESLKRNIFYGIAVIGAAAGLMKLCYFDRFRNNQNSVNETNVTNAIKVDKNSIDYRLNKIIDELKKDPKVLERNYNALAEIVDSSLALHPDYAIHFITNGVSVLGDNIPKDVYFVMFDKIKDKAEQNPQILDYFGKNAQTYMDKKHGFGKYIDNVESFFSDIFSNNKNESKK